jgi:hypothetical protein
MSAISATITNGIEFGIDYPSPLTITSTGFINAGTNGYRGAAIYAGAATALLLVNFDYQHYETAASTAASAMPRR